MMTLTCISCQTTYPPSPNRYICNHCGPIRGTLVVAYPYDQIRSMKAITPQTFKPSGSMFQFHMLLPIGSHTPIDIAIGGTPLLLFEGILGLKRLLIKNEGQGFSGSLKDRASIIALNLALTSGFSTIFCASTGNAASSLALTCAHSEIQTVIYVPSTIPKAKLAQLKAAGVTLKIVDGTYDEAYDLSLEEGIRAGWYCRNSAYNPYLLEGKKTAAFEILVQNGYQVPRYCLVGVGDGTVVSALVKGFEEFKALGLTSTVPIVIGVQAEGASAVYRASRAAQGGFEGGGVGNGVNNDKGPGPDQPPPMARTLADSISVGNPRDVVKAVTLVARTGGWFEVVSDTEIREAMIELTQKTGVFAEPAGAVPYAALKNLVAGGTITADDEVVLVVTGSGLKDPRVYQGGEIL